jgi:hypothetical protein
MKRKRETLKIAIKINRVAIGHQQHITGTGVHNGRPKRQRTRQAQRSAWRKECF